MLQKGVINPRDARLGVTSGPSHPSPEPEHGAEHHVMMHASMAVLLQHLALAASPPAGSPPMQSTAARQIILSCPGIWTRPGVRRPTTSRPRRGHPGHGRPNARPAMQRSGAAAPACSPSRRLLALSDRPDLTQITSSPSIHHSSSHTTSCLLTLAFLLLFSSSIHDPRLAPTACMKERIM